MPRRFRYLRDPVFLIAVAVHLINRFVIRPLTGDPGDFFHCYLNDLICVPVWLPVVLWLERRIGVREHDEPPTIGELAAMVVVWSIVFEVLIPGSPLHAWFPNTVGDDVDVIMYGAGAVLAGACWRSGLPPLPETAPPGYAFWQHAFLAATIVTATAIAGVAVRLEEPWHAVFHEQRVRAELQRIAERVEEAKQHEGHLPTRLTEQLLEGECHGYVVSIEHHGERFALVCLGEDGVPGGADEDADVWWPEERQTRAPLVDRLQSMDAKLGVWTGSILGTLLAGAWLLWRWLQRPPLARISGRKWLLTVASLGLSLAVATLVLAVQNIPPGGH